ncbi:MULTISPECIES: aldehyde dehydrogenase family protein [Alteromonas]|uniref:Aldehyde dehydrogenase n=1 Tax=Alteromonas stellipolaris TaxID=233316 RepID=A0AAW7Z166_9ALTE|nr:MULTISPECIES: aldehyde dehydrogenase family protein [Alteromonas]AMJ92214.1 aldehyde dehydrogenase [Alteromonas sp. Mac2]ALM92855.1 Delta-1-pyrroline-5-carboxylate dehydrogenase [Alteromonas stellipolaris LMG 21856]AMJ75932.1 aldehyde dehydrogenase [Alteromonas stellipolaris]AMJ88359.1 aldehyde dehydrogenase [Alteromonas sp. Mac1]ANB20923.1 aldehyde dehydrogenase [Alteromonas stellipolaris]
MLKDSYPYYLASEPCFANTDLDVTNKYTGEVATKVALADAGVIDKAIAAAEKAQPAMTALAPYERQAILEYCVKRFTEREEELGKALCIEAGKPIKDAKGEVARLIDTFKIAAEESVRINGEVVNLEISARAKGYQGMTKKVPIGPCSFISPFNFPLNLAAHKVAPAIAAGCTFVLKPASRTPIGALIIGEVLAECELMPKGAFSILPCSRDGADLFTTDERLKLLSFTGSPDVGWALKAKAGKKPVVLELGGNAACVVDEDADISDAIDRIIVGAYYQSGQSCISVQRLLVHSSIYDDFKSRYVERVKALVSGDPSDEDTFIGPMISEGEAKRLEGWIKDAKEAGASVLCGGERDGAMLQATVMENVPKDCDASAEEAFGPLSVLQPFDDYDSALDEVNNSRYGLQAGIFTRDIYKAHKAWNVLEVGGVVIGDVPSWRVDNMPYGGVKDSGLGREGIRYAIEDMTETRLMVIRTP